MFAAAMLPSFPLVAQACEFATLAHAGQVRNYTGEPYINHPAAVVRILESAGVTDESMLAAAWLHDVVEDCGISGSEIYERFGARVSALVWLLTNEPLSSGNRATRDQLNIMRLSGAPADAQTIKLADLIHNSESIVARDPHFAKKYMAEKKAVLAVLTKGDVGLRARAQAIVDAYYRVAA